jgi:hypothetical protein
MGRAISQRGSQGEILRWLRGADAETWCDRSEVRGVGRRDRRTWRAPDQTLPFLLLLLLKLRQVLRAEGLGTNDCGGRPLFRLRRVYGRYRHPHAELTFRLAFVHSPCGRDIRIVPSKCHANMAFAAPQTFTRFYLDGAGSRQFTAMTARRRGNACIAFRRRGFLRAGDWPARGWGKS